MRVIRTISAYKNCAQPTPQQTHTHRIKFGAKNVRKFAFHCSSACDFRLSSERSFKYFSYSGHHDPEKWCIANEFLCSDPQLSVAVQAYEEASRTPLPRSSALNGYSHFVSSRWKSKTRMSARGYSIRYTATMLVNICGPVEYKTPRGLFPWTLRSSSRRMTS